MRLDELLESDRIEDRVQVERRPGWPGGSIGIGTIVVLGLIGGPQDIDRAP